MPLDLANPDVELGVPAVVVRRPRGWRTEMSGLKGVGLAMPLLVMVALFLLYPLVRMVQLALGAPNGVGNISKYFEQPSNLVVLRVTFVDAAIVAIISVALGAIVAWYITVTARKIVRAALVASIFVPFWMGSVVKLYAFTVLLERLGLVNRILLDLHIINSPLNLIYNQFAVVLGMVYQLLPYSVLPLFVVFRSVDVDLLRAAQSLGASRITAIRTILLPLSLPGFLASTTIVYVIGLGFFLTPVLLGGATSPFAASFMYDDIFSYYDFTDAAVSALVLLAGAGLVLFVASRFVGKEQLRRVLG